MDNAYQSRIKDYIIQCLTTDETEGKSVVEIMQHASDRFHSEYCYEYNLRRYPIRQERLSEYLQGLPFDFAFTNDDILQTYPRLIGMEPVPEWLEESVLVRWFSFLALHIIRYADELGIDFGSSKGRTFGPDSIFYECLRLGLELDHHYSDLYIKHTPESAELMAKFTGYKTTFRSTIDGSLWYDLVGAYTPYWMKRTN